MPRIKRRTFSGTVCEQEVYFVSDRTKDIKNSEPRVRFKTDEEREAHRSNISRKKHARIFNENFSPTSIYSTHTLCDECEVHTFAEARRMRDNYARRLQRAAPEARFIIYMGRGKHTNRIHFHMVSEGIPEDVIVNKWKYGTITRINYLRAHNYYDGVDHGQDYTGLANYLHNHWTPEQGGHRWRGTTNLRPPDREDPTECKRDYTVQKPPIAPKGYTLVEARASQWHLYYKYVRLPEKKRKKRKPAPGVG